MTSSAIEAVLDRMHTVLGGFYAGVASRADMAGLLASDVAWHVPGSNAIAGDYRGVDEVIGYFTQRRNLAAGTFRMTPRDTLVGGSEHVGVLTDGTATIGGIERRWSTLGLYRISRGRIAECWLLPLDPVAFDEVWTVSACTDDLCQPGRAPAQGIAGGPDLVT